MCGSYTCYYMLYMLYMLLHVQLGLGWDVFQNGWDGSQPLRRFVHPPQKGGNGSLADFGGFYGI